MHVALESFLIHDHKLFPCVQTLNKLRCVSEWDLQKLGRSYKMKKDELHLGSGIDRWCSTTSIHGRRGELYSFSKFLMLLRGIEV